MSAFGPRSQLHCPTCGAVSRNETQRLYRFLKFFNRLTELEPDKIGLRAVSYLTAYWERDDIPFTHLGEIEFQCLKCDHVFLLSREKLRKFSSEPGLYRCRSCKAVVPKLKDGKEFFTDWYWYQTAGDLLLYADVCFDFYGPVGISCEEMRQAIRRLAVLRNKRKNEPPSA